MSGIALFDHPENAEHPGFFGEIAVPEQMSILHHPPDELEDDRFRLQFGGLCPCRCYTGSRCRTALSVLHRSRAGGGLDGRSGLGDNSTKPQLKRVVISH